MKLPRNIHQGFIKDYDGATLMHCQLNPKIVYTEFTSVVRKAKEVSLCFCEFNVQCDTMWSLNQSPTS